MCRCLRLFKKLSVFAAVLCVFFMLATVALAIMLGIKMRAFQDLDELTPALISGQGIPSPLLEEVYSTSGSANGNLKCGMESEWPRPSGSLHAKYKRAAIATDHGYCSEIGRNVLFRGGNAVDSAIASLLCIGVMNPQSSGLGGGFQMTIFNATTQRCMVLDARETAPSGADAEMFVNTPLTSDNGSVFGYRSIAVPGELHGYFTAFTNHGSGKVTWESLFEPAIALARDGFPVSSNLAMVLQKLEAQIGQDEDMRRVFFDKRTNKPYEEGDIMKRQRLAETLRKLATASDPIKLFYKEITGKGGLITVDDLAAYETRIIDNPLDPGDLVVCGPPPPSSFAVSQAIINVMSEFYRSESAVDLNDPLVYHRLIEIEKFAYAQRTKLGDIKFVKDAQELSQNMTTPYDNHTTNQFILSVKDTAQPQEYYSRDLTAQVPDHGTAHVSALDHEGNAVSVTSTINLLLGSNRISPTLGILWNDQMDDFSTPGKPNAFGFAPSPTNFIAPGTSIRSKKEQAVLGKKPMSSMSPAIVYDKRESKVKVFFRVVYCRLPSTQLKMVVGASGGSRIISAVAQTVIRTLLFNQTVKEAVDAPRIHNQFAPYVTEYEENIPKSLINVLIDTYKQEGMNPVQKQASVVQALVHEKDGFIHGNSDFRRQTATYPGGF
ncbi:Gamma-glutamyltranspeptidase domain containing protein [Aphelenchoides besseyi]|nr:Gamma-glutamyltranspeptidase domain containing protein [Aphelenchoides besseyi]